MGNKRELIEGAIYEATFKGKEEVECIKYYQTRWWRFGDGYDYYDFDFSYISDTPMIIPKSTDLQEDDLSSVEHFSKISKDSTEAEKDEAFAEFMKISGEAFLQMWFMLGCKKEMCATLNLEGEEYFLSFVPSKCIPFYAKDVLMDKVDVRRKTPKEWLKSTDEDNYTYPFGKDEIEAWMKKYADYVVGCYSKTKFSEVQFVDVLNWVSKQLQQQLFLMTHLNAYPVEAVPNATILSLSSLFKYTDYINYSK